MSKMSREEILTKVQSAFKEAMGNDVDVTIDSDKDAVADWDSINHLNLIVELEGGFDLDLSMTEIEELISVKKIVEIIEARQA